MLPRRRRGCGVFLLRILRAVLKTCQNFLLPSRRDVIYFGYVCRCFVLKWRFGKKFLPILSIFPSGKRSPPMCACVYDKGNVSIQDAALGSSFIDPARKPLRIIFYDFFSEEHAKGWNMRTQNRNVIHRGTSRVAGTNSGNSDNCPRSGRVLMIRINPFVIQLYIYRPFHDLRYVRLAISRHISPVQCIRSLFGFNPSRRPDIAGTWPMGDRESFVKHFVTLM